MRRLIATVPILYGNKQYEPGEELPTSNPSDVSAWEGCGSAVWVEENSEGNGAANATAKSKTAPKAKRITARAGVEGIAQPATGAEPDLAGVVPSGKARGAVKEPAKRRKKSEA